MAGHAILHRDGSVSCSLHGSQTVQGTLPNERCIACDLAQDLLFYDTACRYCLMPEVEAAWRHDHNGDGEFHWHHRLDPGDGLVSDCANSHLFEEIWALAKESTCE